MIVSEDLNNPKDLLHSEDPFDQLQRWHSRNPDIGLGLEGRILWMYLLIGMDPLVKETYRSPFID